MSDHHVPVDGARYENGDGRAAREGIVEPYGVGTSGYRLRYVVESLGNPHAYPPNRHQGVSRSDGRRGAERGIVI